MTTKKAPAVHKRPDGFYEVDGVAGYHNKDDAHRVARQMAEAAEAAEAEAADDDGEDEETESST